MVYCGTTGTENVTSDTCLVDHSFAASDLDNMAMDFIAQYAIALISFVTLIALVALAVWFKVKTNKLR